MSRIARCVLLLALLSWAAACGYRSALPEPVAPSPGPDDRGRVVLEREAADRGRAEGPIRLAVVGLRNDSPEPWLGRIVTDALRRELGMRAAFELVPDPARADIVLRGRIRPFETRAESFSSFIAALEYAVTLALDLELLRAPGQVVRLDERGLVETEIYLASPDIEVTRTNRLEALRRLSDLLATRVADSIELIERPAAQEGGG